MRNAVIRYDRDGSNFFDGSCGDNQHITGISSTGAISCAADSGDISGVVAGAGLSGGGSSGTVTLSKDALSCVTVKSVGGMSAAVTANCPAGYTAVLGYCGGAPTIWGDEGGFCYLIPNANAATGLHRESLAGFSFTIWVRCCK